MIKLTNELKAKLLAAGSAEEAAELIKADGQEITPEDTIRLWDEIEARREDGRKLSLDELETVSGGRRDWLSEGCAATVEAGSDCWGTDACDYVNVCYDYFDAEQKCPNHPGPHKDEVVSCETGKVLGFPSYTATYRCKYCGRTHKEAGMTTAPPVGPGTIIVG